MISLKRIDAPTHLIRVIVTRPFHDLIHQSVSTPFTYLKTVWIRLLVDLKQPLQSPLLHRRHGKLKWTYIVIHRAHHIYRSLARRDYITVGQKVGDAARIRLIVLRITGPALARERGLTNRKLYRRGRCESDCFDTSDNKLYKCNIKSMCHPLNSPAIVLIYLFLVEY